jgi:hypothetical protein
VFTPQGGTKKSGLLKRQGKVYTEIDPDCSAAVLQKVDKGKVDVGSVIYSDGWL